MKFKSKNFIVACYLQVQENSVQPEVKPEILETCPINKSVGEDSLAKVEGDSIDVKPDVCEMETRGELALETGNSEPQWIILVTCEASATLGTESCLSTTTAGTLAPAIPPGFPCLSELQSATDNQWIILVSSPEATHTDTISGSGSVIAPSLSGSGSVIAAGLEPYRNTTSLAGGILSGGIANVGPSEQTGAVSLCSDVMPALFPSAAAAATPDWILVVSSTAPDVPVTATISPTRNTTLTDELISKSQRSTRNTSSLTDENMNSKSRQASFSVTGPCGTMTSVANTICTSSSDCHKPISSVFESQKSQTNVDMSKLVEPANVSSKQNLPSRQRKRRKIIRVRKYSRKSRRFKSNVPRFGSMSVQEFFKICKRFLSPNMLRLVQAHVTFGRRRRTNMTR